MKIPATKARFYVSEIIAGERVVEVLGGGDREILCLRPPTHRQRQLAELKYHNALAQAKEEGIRSRVELAMELHAQGVLTDPHVIQREEEVKLLLDRTDTILKISSSPSQRRLEEKKREVFQRELADLSLRRHGGLNNCAEVRAEQARTLSLVIPNIFRLDGAQRWESEAAFGDEPNTELQNVAVSEYLQYVAGYPVKLIRALARHLEWKLYWIAYKDSGASLFTGPVGDWTETQRLLVYWSRFYDSLHNYKTPPRPEIIEDDDRLDKWVEDQNIIFRNQSGVSMSYDAKTGKAVKTIHVNEPFKLVTKAQVES